MLGAIVVTVAKNQQYLLSGRFVLGFGVAITTTAAPSYVVEMSPPQVADFFGHFISPSDVVFLFLTVARSIDRSVSLEY